MWSFDFSICVEAFVLTSKDPRVRPLYTTVGGKLDVGEMFTIFLGVPRIFFLVISLKAYLFQILSFVFILWKFCWFPSLPWHDRSTSNKKIHSFEFEFLYFHLCQVSYFSSSVKSV